MASPEEDLAWKRKPSEWGFWLKLPGRSSSFNRAPHAPPQSLPTKQERSCHLSWRAGGAQGCGPRASPWRLPSWASMNNLVNSPCLGLWQDQYPMLGCGFLVTSQVNMRRGPTHMLCFVFQPLLKGPAFLSASQASHSYS